jgi:tetrahydromethanopterin S-methyltransferase subunit B
MWTGEDRREGGDIPSLVLYRLDQVEKKLSNLDDKVNTLTTGFIGMKVELGHVAKNEGKTSGAISGVVTGVIIGVVTYVVQSIK